MAFEKTQSGNPHRLTVRQHIIPKALISQFSNERGQVQLKSKRLGKTLSLDPDADMFVAKRLWDQKAEIVGKKIEDAFISLALAISKDTGYSIQGQDKLIVEEFYALWRSRHQFRVAPLPDAIVNGIPGDDLDINSREVIEKKHGMYIQPDSSVPARFSMGIQITINIDQFVDRVRDYRWGILRSEDGNFLFPDTFSEWLMIPISPIILIAAQCANAVVSREQVSLINNYAIDSSHDYIFSRELSKCPT